MSKDTLQDHFTNPSRAIANRSEIEGETSNVQSIAPPSLNITAGLQLKSEKDQESQENGEQFIKETPAPFDLNINTSASLQMQEEGNEEEQVIDTSSNEYSLDTPDENPPDGEDEDSIETSENSQSEVLESMERAFGTSFSSVKIITDSQEAVDLGAKAFTMGESIYFAPGFYRPNTAEGKKLLAHELTHVVQQREGRVQPTTEKQGFQINDNQNLEDEADRRGNLAVQRREVPAFKLSNSVTSQSTVQQKVVQRQLNESQLSIAIRGLHNYHNSHNAVRILRENHDDLEQLKNAFQNEYNVSLRSYIRHNYQDPDMRVKATALLFDPTYNLPWTQIALALIPPLTRDAEFYRIMSNLNPQQKRELRRKYNARFSTLGEGSLDADIRSDFEGEEKMRAWIISYRSLTDADNIYLDTAGQAGTNEEHVVATLRRLWGYGVDTFDRKLNQWNPNFNLPDVVIANSSPIQWHSYFIARPAQFSMKISEIGAKARSLMYTVLVELSGADKRNVERIFLEYVEQKAGFARAEGEAEGGWAFTQEEESNLRIARERLAGGESWIDDTDEINVAIDQIVAIYHGRVTRLQAIPNNEENVAHAQEALESVRTRLINDHGASDLRVAERNMADEVYFIRGNAEQLENKLLEYFKAGQLEELKQQASTESPIRDAEAQSIRPAFTLVDILNISRVRSGIILNLVSNSGTESTRGAIFIQQIISREYVQATTLNFLHAFINQGTWNAGLKSSILTEYCRRRCPPNADQLRGSVENAVVFHLHQLGFRRFSSWPSFRDTLAPTLSNDVRVARAQEDLEEEETSFLGIGSVATDISDTFTGEDTREVAHTSLENLELFAGRAGADNAEMAVFRSFYSEELDLAGREYRMFHERLGAMRAARNQMASFANTIVSTVLEVAIGLFASPIASAMVAQALGILTEWAINDEADPVTTENMVAILAAGVAAGAGGLLDDSEVLGRMLNERISNQFLRTAVHDAMETSFEEGADLFVQGVSGQIDRQDILNRVENMLASSFTGGLMEGISVEVVTNHVINAGIQGMASGIVEEGSRSTLHIILQPSDSESGLGGRIAQAAFDSTLEGVFDKISEINANSSNSENDD